MTTLKHPTFADVEVEVPDDEVARWTASGWLAPEPAPKKKTRSADTGEHDTSDKENA
jgi:hypothetical protein